jgi:hypothetical protein
VCKEDAIARVEFLDQVRKISEKRPLLASLSSSTSTAKKAGFETFEKHLQLNHDGCSPRRDEEEEGAERILFSVQQLQEAILRRSRSVFAEKKQLW